MFTASVDLSGFRQQVARTMDVLQDAVPYATRIAAQEGAVEAKRSGRFRDRTGNLRAKIVARFVRGTGRSVTWEILAGAPYSKFVEDGTRPHEIWPKAQNGYSGPTRKGQSRRADNDVGVGRGHALRWVSGGQTFFARMVHHPGTQPDHYMSPAYFKAEAVLYREIYVGIDKAARLWT